MIFPRAYLRIRNNTPKIQAIKAIRRYFNLSLLTAKNVIEGTQSLDERMAYEFLGRLAHDVEYINVRSDELNQHRDPSDDFAILSENSRITDDLASIERNWYGKQGLDDTLTNTLGNGVNDRNAVSIEA